MHCHEACSGGWGSMTALPASNRPSVKGPLSRVNAAWNTRCTGLALALFALGGPGLAAEAAAAEAGKDQPITAVYKAHELSFQYRGTSQLYTCPELEQRVALIMIGVGARDDVKVNARNCNFGFMPEEEMSIDPTFGRDRMDDRWGGSGRLRQPTRGREQATSIRIEAMFPVEVTPKVLEELDKDKSRRELVSRVTGNAAAAFNDPILFEAQRQEVTLSHRTTRLRGEDCDLLEQMSQQVFRRLNVRVVRRSFNCQGASNIPPQITVESLLPTGRLKPMPDPEQEKNKSGSAAPEGSAAQPTAQPAEPPAEPAPQ